MFALVLRLAAMFKGDSYLPACLPVGKTPAEFVNVIVCLGKKGFTDLPHLGHDWITPYFDWRPSSLVTVNTSYELLRCGAYPILLP